MGFAKLLITSVSIVQFFFEKRKKNFFLKALQKISFWPAHAKYYMRQNFIKLKQSFIVAFQSTLLVKSSNRYKKTSFSFQRKSVHMWFQVCRFYKI